MSLLATFLRLTLVAREPDATADPLDHVIAAAQAYAAVGAYEQALSTVRAASRATNEPALIFVEAQLLRLSGDCATATERYREFLATKPGEQDRAAAEENLRRCAGEAPKAVDPDAQVVSQIPVPGPIITPRVRNDPSRPLRPEGDDRTVRRPSHGVGIALWTIGGVAAAAGVGLFAGAWGQRANGEHGSPTLDEYLAREQRARTLNGVGIAAMSVGASVLIVATIRHLLRKRMKRHRQASRFSLVNYRPGAR